MDALYPRWHLKHTMQLVSKDYRCKNVEEKTFTNVDKFLKTFTNIIKTFIKSQRVDTQCR